MESPAGGGGELQSSTGLTRKQRDLPNLVRCEWGMKSFFSAPGNARGTESKILRRASFGELFNVSRKKGNSGCGASHCARRED